MHVLYVFQPVEFFTGWSATLSAPPITPLTFIDCRGVTIEGFGSLKMVPVTTIMLSPFQGEEVRACYSYFGDS